MITSTVKYSTVANMMDDIGEREKEQWAVRQIVTDIDPHSGGVLLIVVFELSI